MKIVINSSFGAFQLSDKAHELYAELKGYKLIKDGSAEFRTFYKNEESDENIIDEYEFNRNDADLVKVVETLGEKAGHGKYCKPKVVEIPDGIEWYIDDRNQGGGEFVAEKHRTWK
jgi:hypothetical protein